MTRNEQVYRKGTQLCFEQLAGGHEIFGQMCHFGNEKTSQEGMRERAATRAAIGGKRARGGVGKRIGVLEEN